MTSRTPVTRIHGIKDPAGKAVEIEMDGAHIVGSSSPTTMPDTVDGDLHLDGDWVVVAGMAESHAHADKAYVAEMLDTNVGDLDAAVGSFERAVLEGVISSNDCEARATRAFNQAITMGCTAIRTHVDCGAETSFDHLEAVQRAQRWVEGLIDVQTVALIYQPVVGPDAIGNRRALDRAIEQGATAIGGAPQFAEDSHAAIDFLMAVASEARLPLDLHVDETLEPSARDLEYVAQRVLDTGFDRPVTASHCVSLGAQDAATQRRIASLVHDAGISIVTLPQTNLLLQARAEAVLKPRGLSALRPLIDAGVVVAGGSDNTEDPFNPLGRLDPLETASLLVSAGHTTVEEALTMITSAARAAMGLEPCGLLPGTSTNLTLVRGTSFRSALAAGGFERLMIRGGHLVDVLEGD